MKVKFPMALGESPAGSITLNPSSASLEQGKSVQLKATVKPTSAKVNWKSSNTKIATVSASGLVKGIAPGTATITATNNATNYGVECKVTVFDKSVAFNVQTRTIQVGKTYTIIAIVLPNLGSNVYEWSSSNAAVATVDSKGKVTAKKVGTTNIVLKVT